MSDIHLGIRCKTCGLIADCDMTCSESKPVNNDSYKR